MSIQTVPVDLSDKNYRDCVQMYLYSRVAATPPYTLPNDLDTQTSSRGHPPTRQASIVRKNPGASVHTSGRF